MTSFFGSPCNCSEMDVDLIKLYICKNDFLLINYLHLDRPSDTMLAALARHVCRRKTGIGANGLLLILPGKHERIRIKLYTPFGYPAELCNDALFSLGRYAFDSGQFSEGKLRVETDNGIREIEAIDSNNFRISLGPPFNLETNGEMKELPNREYTQSVVLDNRQYMITPLLLQQKGAIFFTNEESIDSMKQLSESFMKSSDQQLRSLQPIFVIVLSREDIIVYTWYKRFPKDYISAASLGATASIVNGFCDNEIIIHNKQEHCYFQWNQESNNILVTAAPKYVFSGSYYFEERTI